VEHIHRVHQSGVRSEDLESIDDDHIAKRAAMPRRDGCDLAFGVNHKQWPPMCKNVWRDCRNELAAARPAEHDAMRWFAVPNELRLALARGWSAAGEAEPA